MNDILKYDPNFSVEKFITYANNVFVQIHVAIITKELDKIKHFVSSNVYDELSVKVNQLTQKGLTQMYDELNVKDSYIIGIEETENYYEIKVQLISRYMDYQIDKTTRQYKSGNNQSRVEKTHILTFQKKKNAQVEGMSRTCPGCGASVNANSSGVCEYCGTVYNTEDYDWILMQIKTQ